MSTKVPYNDTTQMLLYLAQGPAPAGDAEYSLQIKAGEESYISFPATVTITSGNQHAVFDITWLQAGTTILQAQLTEYDGSPVTGTVYEQTITCVDAPIGGGGGIIEGTGTVDLHLRGTGEA